MSEGQTDTAPGKAGTHDIRRLAHVGWIDVLGGPWLALLLALCLVLVLLVDGLGLPTLAALTGRTFHDSCGADLPGPAGGYALALFLVCMVDVALCGLIAPRSTWASLPLLILVCALPFIVMPLVPNAMVDALSLDGILEAAASRVPGFDWLDAAFGLACGSGSPVRVIDWLNDRYSSGIDGNFASHVMAYSMLANLLIGIAWGVVLLIPALMALLYRLVRSRRGSPAAGRTARGAERTITLWLAAGALLLFLALPSVVALSANPLPVSEAVLNLLWIGPLVFLLDRGRLMLRAEPAPADAANARRPAPPEPAAWSPVLPAALATLGRELGAVLQLKARFEADPGQSAGPRQVAFPADGRASQTYLEGALTPALVGRLAEFLAREVLDKGSSLLVLCPAGSLQEVRNQLDAAFRGREGDLAIGWITDIGLRPAAPRPGDAAQRRPKADIVLADPEALEEILRDSAEFEQLLWRLGGIVMLQADALDIGLLRATFNRLQVLVPARADLCVVVQAESRHGLDARVGNLPMLSAIDQRHQVKGADFGPHRDHSLAMIDYRPESRLDKGSDLWPAHLRAMLILHAKHAEATPTYLDRDARFSVDATSRAMTPVFHNRGETDLLTWVQSLPLAQIGVGSGLSPVGVIDDRWNLADSCLAGVADDTARESMTVVTTGTYPTSPFLADQLGRALAGRGTPAEKRQALADFHRAYGAIMPHPADGPAELLLMTVRELAGGAGAAQWVGQRRLREIWATASPRMLSQFGITVSRAGLARLFEVVAETRLQDGDIQQRRDLDRTRQFRIGGAAVQGLSGLEMLRVHIGSPIERVLPLADHGLSYAAGSRMMVDGLARRVESVLPAQRSLRMLTDNDRPVREYCFARDYAFPTEGGADRMAAEGYQAQTAVRLPYERAVGYLPLSRVTRAFLEWGTLSSPFSATESPVRTDCRIAASARLRRVALLRLSAGARPPTQNSARLEFTLAATLSDVVATLFPLQAHRLAVMPLPPAADDLDLREAAAGREDRVRAFALLRQPRLVRSTEMTLTPALPKAGEPGARQFHEEWRKRADAFFRAAQPLGLVRGGPVQTGPAQTGPALILVEDSDHDLGVARAFSEDFSTRVLPFWAEFVTWCARRMQAPQGHPYGFGADEVPSLYDFPGAAEVLKGMRQ